MAKQQILEAGTPIVHKDFEKNPLHVGDEIIYSNGNGSSPIYNDLTRTVIEGETSNYILGIGRQKIHPHLCTKTKSFNE
jgi:hypothetical protein